MNNPPTQTFEVSPWKWPTNPGLVTACSRCERLSSHCLDTRCQHALRTVRSWMQGTASASNLHYWFRRVQDAWLQHVAIVEAIEPALPQTLETFSLSRSRKALDACKQFRERAQAMDLDHPGALLARYCGAGATRHLILHCQQGVESTTSDNLQKATFFARLADAFTRNVQLELE